MIREEPLSMTLLDVMALTVGVALSLVFRPQSGGIPIVPPGWVMMVLSIAMLLWLGASAVSTVVIVRIARYRRNARPAEWLSILTVLIGRQVMGPSSPIDGWLELLPEDSGLRPGSIETARWIAAGLILGLVLMVLGLLRLGRRRVPFWFRTIVLIGLIEMMLIGPIQIVGLQGPEWIAPRAGFGPGSFWILYWLTSQLIALIPLGLLLGIPSMGASIERIQRLPWRWTEWAGFSGFSMVCLTLSSLLSGTFSSFSLGWLAERAILGGWFLVVGLLSWWIVVKIGPRWARWLGDHDPSVSREEPASTS